MRVNKASVAAYSVHTHNLTYRAGHNHKAAIRQYSYECYAALEERETERERQFEGALRVQS